MEKKLFKTKILGNHRLGDNKYIKGRISGIQFVVCDNCSDNLCANLYDDETKDLILITPCFDEQYMKFMEIVEKEYPGLCIFDITNELFKAEA